MTDLIIRPLLAGEENLFDSLPDPLPELRQVSYADGLAGGGYRPANTWIAIRDGLVVARAAWLQPPGAVGEPWLERFDVAAGEPETGATLLRAAHDGLGGPKPYYASMPPDWRLRPDVLEAMAATLQAARLAGLVERGERIRFAWSPSPAGVPAGKRFSFRPAASVAEIKALVARIAEPEVLTGVETARLMRGVDLARAPLDWLSGRPADWRVALTGDDGRQEPVGLAAPAGDVCYPMIAYLGVLDDAARSELIADAVAALAAGGALQVVADAGAQQPALIADLRTAGFKPIRSRVLFEPAGR